MQVHKTIAILAIGLAATGCKTRLADPVAPATGCETEGADCGLLAPTVDAGMACFSASGTRITVLHAPHPAGFDVPESFAFLGGGTAANLAQYLAPGQNRLVLTHLDDCCQASIISGARITVDAQEPPCP